MHNEVILWDGIEQQGVWSAFIIEGVDGLQNGLSRMALNEFEGKIGASGFAFTVEQVDLGRGAVDGLVNDDVEDVSEAFGIGGVEIPPDTLEGVLVFLLEPDADDERLDDDALGSKSPRDRTGVLVTGLDAIGDQQNDIPSRPSFSAKSSAARSKERAIGVVPCARSFLSSC